MQKTDTQISGFPLGLKKKIQLFLQILKKWAECFFIQIGLEIFNIWLYGSKEMFLAIKLFKKRERQKIKKIQINDLEEIISKIISWNTEILH